ncbi:MAG: hypothetical protein ACXVEV_10510 [Nocardioidaceae bacterium]
MDVRQISPIRERRASTRSGRLARCAAASGAFGVAGFVLLIVVYAQVGLGLPGAGVVGPVDDLLGVPQALFALPVLLALPPAADATAARWVRRLAAGALLVAPVVAVAMTVGWLSFDIETPISSCCYLLWVLWLWQQSSAWARVGTRRVPARWGILVGRVTLAALAACGLGLALLWVPWLGIGLLALGLTVGVLSYGAAPVWWLLLARALDDAADPL